MKTNIQIETYSKYNCNNSSSFYILPSAAIRLQQCSLTVEKFLHFVIIMWFSCKQFYMLNIFILKTLKDENQHIQIETYSKYNCNNSSSFYVTFCCSSSPTVQFNGWKIYTFCNIIILPFRRIVSCQLLSIRGPPYLVYGHLIGE